MPEVKLDFFFSLDTETSLKRLKRRDDSLFLYQTSLNVYMLKLREVETEISHHSAEAAKSTPVIYFVFWKGCLTKR